MNQKWSKCIDCGYDQPVNSKGRCKGCTYKLNHNGMSQFEVAMVKEKEKPVKIYRIQRKPLKTRKNTLKFKPRKATGEYEVFLEIWKERDHECVNCGMNLDRFVDNETGNPSAMLFSHKKTKGSRGDLRLDKDNIDLNCMECHYAHEHVGDEAFNARKDIHREK